MKRFLKYLLISLLCLALSQGCKNETQNELILFDFETEASLDRFHWSCFTMPSISDHHITHGKHALKFEFYPSAYPGLSPKLEFHDWQKFKAFSFNVYNPSSDSVRLVLRIDDQEDATDYKERYNKGYIINPGVNTVKVILNSLITSGTNRKMDLKKIYRFVIFMVNPDKKYVLYLDYFRLTS